MRHANLSLGGFEDWMTIYSIAVCLGGLIILGILMLSVKACWIKRIKLETYRCVRTFFAIVIAAHAVVSVWRIATSVAIGRQLELNFVPELVGYLLFWILFPPTWFFLEYLGADSGVIIDPAGKSVDPKSMKDYQDLASKIWAAVVAALIVLISLKTK